VPGRETHHGEFESSQAEHQDARRCFGAHTLELQKLFFDVIIRALPQMFQGALTHICYSAVQNLLQPSFDMCMLTEKTWMIAIVIWY
jgi:hypothetical protein